LLSDALGADRGGFGVTLVVTGGLALRAGGDRMVVILLFEGPLAETLVR
jgi:hypothetical protein